MGHSPNRVFFSIVAPRTEKLTCIYVHITFRDYVKNSNLLRKRDSNPTRTPLILTTKSLSSSKDSKTLTFTGIVKTLTL